MAVQKSRRSRSTRGMRRSHDKLTGATLSVDSESGEIHRRHHVSAKGYYRGRLAVVVAAKSEKITDVEE